MQYPPRTDTTSRLRRLWRFLTTERDERRGLCSECGLPLGAADVERVDGRLVHQGACADEAWRAAQW